MRPLTDLYQAVYRGTLLTDWEKKALSPKDIARTPAEVHSRCRVAEVIRALRREEPPQIEPGQVLSELKSLVLEQTKSLNCYHAFEVEEIKALELVVNGLDDWSRLVKLLGQTRELSMKRYNAEANRRKQARRIQQEQEDQLAA
jgi:hypothetical protein